MTTIQQIKPKFQNYQGRVKIIMQTVREKYGITGKFTDADFYRICEGEGIILLNSDEARALKLETQGLYFPHPSGERFIYLRSFFSKKLNLQVATHELGHHFLGHAELNFKAKTARTLLEREANYFALLAAKK